MKKTNKKIAIIAVLLVAAMISAFAFIKGKGDDSAKVANSSEVSKELKIVHELGEVTIDKTPKKVVVFDYGVLDALDKMEVEVTALPKSNIPAYLEKFKTDKYVDVGTLQEPNFEKIYEIKPDVIIISARQAKHYEELKKIAPTLYVKIDDKDYMSSFKNNMNTLGKVFGKEAFVERELKAIENNVKTLNDKATSSGKNALVVLANDGALSAYGETSRFGVIHKAFGFTPVDKNIEVSTHGQSISFEYIVEKNPDYIFVVDRAAVTGGSKTAKQVLENELIKTTKAYKENKIVYLDAATWYVSSGGFSSTAKMISEVDASIK